MLRNKEAIIFDLDGTLVDSMWMWKTIDIEYLGRYGLEVPESLQRDIEGFSFYETAVHFKNRFQIPESLEEIQDTWREMADYKYRHDVPLKKGVLEFLKYVKKIGKKLAIASSNSYALVEATLEALHVREYFDVICTCDEVKNSKPAPDVYLRAAGLLGVNPGKCLVFEDIPFGIMSGKQAGMTVCAVEDVYSMKDREEKMRLADFYIKSYEELL